MTEAANLIDIKDVVPAYEAINPAHIRINKPHRLVKAKAWLEKMGQSDLYARLVARAEQIDALESKIGDSDSDGYAGRCEQLQQFLNDSVPSELTALRNALIERL